MNQIQNPDPLSKLKMRIPPWVPVLAGIGVVAATIFLWQAIMEKERAHIENGIELKARYFKNEILGQLKPQILSLVRMAQRWEVVGRPSFAEWKSDAELYIKHSPIYQAIGWVDPTFHVRWIVPLEGNSEAKNLALKFKKDEKATFEKAKDEHKILLSNKVELVQGGTGFIVYVPIFNAENFDGFICGVFRFKKLFDNILSKEITHGFSIALFDNEEEIYRKGSSDGEIEKKFGQDLFFDLFNITWHLRVWPEPEWVEEEHSLLPEVVLVLGILMAILMAWAIHLAQRDRLRAGKIQGFNQELETEITERKRFEEALIHSEALVRSILKYAADGIIIINEQGIIETFNFSAEKIFLYPSNEVMGKKVNMLMPEPYRSEHDHYIQRYLSTGEAKIIGIVRELSGMKKDGTIFLIELAVSEVYLAERGKRFVGIVRDITERKEAQAKLEKYADTLELRVNQKTSQLKASEERIRTIIDNVPAFICYLDPEERYDFVNKTYGDWFGKLTEEMVGKKLYEVFGDEQYKKVKKNVQLALSGKTVHFENRITSTEGKSIDVDVSYIPDIDNKKECKGFFVLATDIAERKRISTELKKFNQVKSEFLCTATHELRTPLTSIRGFSELLKTRGYEDPKKVGKFIARINKESEYLAHIVDDLLDISRIESGEGLSLNRTRCEVGEIINQEISSFQDQHGTHRFDVVLPEEPGEWLVDKEKIAQVLQNLLSNAIKYSPDCKMIRIEATSDKSDYFMVSIIDQGIGMTQETVYRIFDKFYRADVYNNTVRGTGLGMTIVKQIVEAHKGEVSVESELGKGTTVGFTIPKKI